MTNNHNDMDYDVFISHSRKDAAIVSQICSLLKENGISYWLDKANINAGNEFMGDIVQAIKGCKITLFISSANSNSSMYTAKEVAMAFNEGKYIIPYKIDTSSFNKNWIVLKQFHLMKAKPWNWCQILNLF